MGRYTGDEFTVSGTLKIRFFRNARANTLTADSKIALVFIFKRFIRLRVVIYNNKRTTFRLKPFRTVLVACRSCAHRFTSILIAANRDYRFQNEERVRCEIPHNLHLTNSNVQDERTASAVLAVILLAQLHERVSADVEGPSRL